ncbi:MAG TPA: GNAT family N-acetyltransferase [Gammaproteobacteria bacterium]
MNTPVESDTCVLRAPRPGDIGWIVHRHGVLYAEEYGWNERFEGLVAEVASDFLLTHDTANERCWIAECDARIAGSIFLMRGDGGFGKLRLLYVEPWTRGLGIGRLLVDTCITAAKDAGYAGLTLWTTSVLHAARRLYEAAGFVLEAEEGFDTFGPRLVGQTWRLVFRDGLPPVSHDV